MLWGVCFYPIHESCRVQQPQDKFWYGEERTLCTLNSWLSQKELSPPQKFSCFVSFLSLFFSFSLYHANGVQTVDHKASSTYDINVHTESIWSNGWQHECENSCPRQQGPWQELFKTWNRTWNDHPRCMVCLVHGNCAGAALSMPTTTTTNQPLSPK